MSDIWLSDRVILIQVWVAVWGWCRGVAGPDGSTWWGGNECYCRNAWPHHVSKTDQGNPPHTYAVSAIVQTDSMRAKSNHEELIWHQFLKQLLLLECEEIKQVPTLLKTKGSVSTKQRTFLNSRNLSFSSSLKSIFVKWLIWRTSCNIKSLCKGLYTVSWPLSQNK